MADAQIPEATNISPSAPVSPISANDVRLGQLEKKLEAIVAKSQPSTVQVSVADMNQMYSNHLNTIDLILGVVSCVVLAGGGLLGFIGYKTLRKLVDTKIDEIVAKKTEEAIAQALVPVRKEYEAIIEEQKRQEEQIQIQEKKIKASEYYSRGMGNYHEENYEQAVTDFNESIALDPDNVVGYRMRGLAKAELNQFESALADMEKAIVLEPDKSVNYNNKGFVRVKAKQFELAIPDLNKAMALDPNNPSPYNNRGSAKVSLGQYESAFEDLNKALELRKDFAHPHLC